MSMNAHEPVEIRHSDSWDIYEDSLAYVRKYFIRYFQPDISALALLIDYTVAFASLCLIMKKCEQVLTEYTYIAYR